MTSSGIIYNQRIGEFSSRITQLRKPLRWIPWFRLLMFVLTGFSVYNSFKFPGLPFIMLSVLAFACFLAAGWYDSRLKKEIRQLEALIQINRQELAALDGDITGFDPGRDFINQEHPYTHDLDIFGTGSLFQYVNRTATFFGRERLAMWFRNAWDYRNDILPRQQAVAELAADIEFRQQLRLIFMNRDTSQGDLDAVTGWLDGKEDSKWQKTRMVFSFLLPLITVSTIVLSAAGMLPSQIPVFMVMMQMTIVFAYERKTRLVHQAVTSQVDILKKYSMALSLAESAGFKSDYNTRLQKKLHAGEGQTPGKVIRQLTGLLSMMDSNLNILISVILNGLLLFNIHVLRAVEKWRRKFRGMVPAWFEVVAELDALSSLGTFSFNNPGYTYPVPVTQEFQFTAVRLGHPLIPHDSCVTNDVEITGWNQFRIITGANMSGKSTFLRTIGANLLLAMMGAPVYAEKLIFYPIEIHSSIRTNDSLARRESYFYAELRRLKEIIGELEQGKEKLILLDEILKGTNSSDKQTGSIALIRQLMKYKLAGLFATHDLALGGAC